MSLCTPINPVGVNRLQGSLTEENAQHGWPPFTDYFRSAPFIFQILFTFFAKQGTLSGSQLYWDFECNVRINESVWLTKKDLANLLRINCMRLTPGLLKRVL